MRTANLVLLAAACFGLEACSNQYWQRTDTINFAAGDAVATNSAVQIPDPWPKGSNNTDIPMDPVKAANAIDQYRMVKETITTSDGSGTRTQTSNTPGLIGTPKPSTVNVNQNQGSQGK